MAQAGRAVHRRCGTHHVPDWRRRHQSRDSGCGGGDQHYRPPIARGATDRRRSRLRPGATPAADTTRAIFAGANPKARDLRRLGKHGAALSAAATAADCTLSGSCSHPGAAAWARVSARTCDGDRSVEVVEELLYGPVRAKLAFEVNSADQGVTAIARRTGAAGSNGASSRSREGPREFLR